MLIYAFCGGVVKDREAPFSLNYVRLKNYENLRSCVITRSLLFASVVELFFSRNLTAVDKIRNREHGTWNMKHGTSRHPGT